MHTQPPEFLEGSGRDSIQDGPGCLSESSNGEANRMFVSARSDIEEVSTSHKPRAMERLLEQWSWMKDPSTGTSAWHCAPRSHLPNTQVGP